MRRIRSKITYANVVATLALFIALGGVSYAAVKLPANSVGEKQLKKNAVTGKKIKKSTITADKIKNGTLTGADINLGALGKVPTAGSADNATNAGNSNTTSHLVTFAKRVGPSANEATQDLGRANATEIPLASNGNVSFYAQCYTVSGSLYAEIDYKTTADGALSYGGGSSWTGSGGFLNTSTPENQRYSMYTSTSNNNYAYSYLGSPPSSITLLGPDGNGLIGQFMLWVKQGTLTPYGNGAYGAGNTCDFQGTITKQDAS